MQNLTYQQRDYLKQNINAFNLINYNIDLIIDNPQSHAKPVEIIIWELTGTKDLLHTARAIKNALLSAKKLLLNDDSDENFEYQYLSIADFWQIDGELMALRYQDYDAEDNDEYDKIHNAYLDAKLFSRAANNIQDYLREIASALQVSANDIENT